MRSGGSPCSSSFTLEATFLRGDLPAPADVDEAESAAWRARLATAVRRLSAAGIETVLNEAAAETYLALRVQWQPHTSDV